MRNLKRALSLVLASVMVFGLMVVGSSAKSGDFKDYDEITYQEAADVLNALEVFIGDENQNFNPGETLNRAMAAKIVATMLLGAENAEKLPANSAVFKDIDANTASWAGGYIAYCANNGIIAGDGNGNFNPNGELTGVQFGKVLLTALGYDATIEGYVNSPSWAIRVASDMVTVGIDVTGVALNDPITREQAAQMALNTIKSPLVEYDARTNVTVNGVDISVGNSDAKYVTSTLAREQRISERILSNTKDNPIYTVEFGEKYIPNLVLTTGLPNAFGTPTSKWAYKTNDIGTYVREDLLAHEYKDTVMSKDLYGEIGYSRLTNYSLFVFVDGAIVDCELSQNPGRTYFTWATDYKNPAEKAIKKDLLLKNDSTKLDDTGKGVLTSVYVDDDEEEIYVVIKNTYLAVADSDYNATNKNLPISIYAAANNIKNVRIDAADFSNVENAVEDDVFKVTMAVKDSENHSRTASKYTGYDVQSVDLAEVISGVTISAYAVGEHDTVEYDRYKLGSLTADGTSYDASAKAYYDPELLMHYNETLDQLKSSTYNLYMDNYNNVLGIREVDKVDNYIFVAGYEQSSTHLAKPVDKANIITTDGVMMTVDIRSDLAKKWDNDAHKWVDADRLESKSTINTWYTFTKDGDTYVLQREVLNQGRDTVNGRETKKNVPDVSGTYAGLTTHNVYVNKTGEAEVPAVYGNDDSVYIAVKADKTYDPKGSIVEVQGVSTGIKDTAIIASSVVQYANFRDEDGWREYNTLKKIVPELEDQYYDSFFIYNDDGYVKYAVIIGENQNTENNMIFFTSDAIGRAYDSSLGGYYVTYNAIYKGEKVTVKVKDSEATDANPVKYDLFKAYFDKNGVIFDLEGYTDDNPYYDNAPLNTTNNKEDGYTQTTASSKAGVKLTLVGNTLYVKNADDEDSYVVIGNGCKIFLKTFNKPTYEEYATVRSALTSLTKESGYVARVTTFVNKTTGYADTLIITEFDTSKDNVLVGEPPVAGIDDDDVKAALTKADDAVKANSEDALKAAQKNIQDLIAEKGDELNSAEKKALDDALKAIANALATLALKPQTLTLKGTLDDTTGSGSSKVPNATVWVNGKEIKRGQVQTEYGKPVDGVDFANIPAGALVHIELNDDYDDGPDDGVYKVTTENGEVVFVTVDGKSIEFEMPNDSITLDETDGTGNLIADNEWSAVTAIGVTAEPVDGDEETVIVKGNTVYFETITNVKFTAEDENAVIIIANDATTKSGPSKTNTYTLTGSDTAVKYVYAGYIVTDNVSNLEIKVGNDTVTSGNAVVAGETISVKKGTASANAVVTSDVSPENVLNSTVVVDSDITLESAYAVDYDDNNINVTTTVGSDDVVVEPGYFVKAGTNVKPTTVAGVNGKVIVTENKKSYADSACSATTAINADTKFEIGTEVVVTGTNAKVYYKLITNADEIILNNAGTKYVVTGTTLYIDNAQTVKIDGKDAVASEETGIQNQSNSWIIPVGNFAKIEITSIA